MRWTTLIIVTALAASLSMPGATSTPASDRPLAVDESGVRLDPTELPEGVAYATGSIVPDQKGVQVLGLWGMGPAATEPNAAHSSPLLWQVLYLTADPSNFMLFFNDVATWSWGVCDEATFSKWTGFPDDHDELLLASNPFAPPLNVQPAGPIEGVDISCSHVEDSRPGAFETWRIAGTGFCVTGACPSGVHWSGDFSIGSYP